MPKWYQPSASPIETPWIHPDAVSYLESILTPDMDVIEFGGGGSSYWLSLRVNSVITYETNPDWAKQIKGATIRPSGMWNTEDNCDLLFIDGEPVHFRGLWLAVVPLFVRKWVVLDNANRPEYKEQREAFRDVADLVHTVNGNEAGTRYLVTEFWRMRENR